jgi:IS605 OrfB family transposase
MSQITIQCRLVASSSTRQQLWKLMASLNTPLINELLVQVRQHPKFESWRQKGKISTVVVEELCEPLKTDPRFIGQPRRFYTSAVATVSYIYKSWLALQKRLQYQLQGKTRWLEMLNSDVELLEATGVTLDILRNKAAEILRSLTPQPATVKSQQKKGKKKAKKSKTDKEKSLYERLFDEYNDSDTEDIMTRCAISYLLKNGCQIPNKEEDHEKFARRRRKVEIQIQRLTKLLEGRLPKGRNLTDTKWLETLLTAVSHVPENEAEAKSWQATLLRKPCLLPFPVIYGSSEDMTWFCKLRLYNIPSNLCFFWFWLYIDYLIVILFLRDALKNEKKWFDNLRLSNINLLIELWSLTLGMNYLASFVFLQDSLKKYKRRICVKFNGLSEHPFEIYCDCSDLHWFNRFLEDQKIKKNSKKQHSSSVFTLRSGRIVWQEEEGKGDPWNINRLTLHCSVDTRLWTVEGTKLVIEEKVEDIAKTITETKKKGDLNDKQLAHIKRKNSTLARINNPFPRPSKPLYKGQSHILVSVSLGLEKPATLAVVDAVTREVITYRSIKQLLGDNYKLLNRQRQQKQALSHKRKIAQTLAAPNQFGDSELGQYLDRLLTKEIIAIAQKYKAGSIVIPKLDNMREQVNSEIQARAEQKCPESLEAQKKYALRYRHSIHQWSYDRLIENIYSSAAKAGIIVEEGKQPVRGSPQEKAKELAFVAYDSRNNS